MKRINDKKGMSLVFAIVMCMFLILITGTITTMAIMQQNETGGELNTRQAYVSAKAGLDSIHDQAALQKLMDNGEIAPPTVSGNSIYFILYYDANGELHAKQYATADLALNAIKNFESMFPNCTLAGDGTYFKMTMNPDGTYSVSALSEEGKYTGASGDVNFSDLSFTATITDEYVVTSKGATLPTEATTQAPTPPPANDNSTPFIMCGQQSAINLWSGEDGNGQSSKFAHSLHSYENVQGSFSFNLHVENGAAPFTSYFPVVFNYGPLYINSDASTRCAIDAKNNDIFIVGRMTDQQLLNIFFNTNYLNYNDLSTEDKNMITEIKNNKVAMYTQNDVFSATMTARTVVLDASVIKRTDNDTSHDVTFGSGTKVWVSNPNGISLYTCDHSMHATSVKHIDQGWYTVTGGMYNGTWTKNDSLKVQDTVNLLAQIRKMEPTETVFAIHSGMEKTVPNTCAMLNSNGEFTNDSNYYCNNSQEMTSFSNKHQNSYIYCAPNYVPATPGKYYLYAGGSFNFLWYNVNDMKLNSSTTINILSNSIGLTFGPSTGETFNGKSPSNVLDGTNSDTHFWLKGFDGVGLTGGGCTVKLYSDMTVKYSGGTYVIPAGTYVTSGPIDLFTDAGRDAMGGVMQTAAGDEELNIMTMASSADSSENLILNVAGSTATTTQSVNGTYSSGKKDVTVSSEKDNLLVGSTAIIDCGNTSDGGIFISAIENVLPLSSSTSSSLTIKSRTYKDGTTDKMYFVISQPIKYTNGKVKITVNTGNYGVTKIGGFDLLSKADWYTQDNNTVTIVHKTTVSIDEGTYF